MSKRTTTGEMTAEERIVREFLASDVFAALCGARELEERRIRERCLRMGWVDGLLTALKQVDPKGPRLVVPQKPETDSKGAPLALYGTEWVAAHLPLIEAWAEWNGAVVWTEEGDGGDVSAVVVDFRPDAAARAEWEAERASKRDELEEERGF